MFSPHKHLFLCVILYVLNSEPCLTEPVFPPMLVLYSPGDPEYTDVLVKRVHDNLTLVCELRGDTSHRSYVWNYVADNGTLTRERPFTIEPMGPTPSSKLLKTDLQLSDSGQYMCSAPPFSVTKYVLVQNKGPVQCARGAFWCGQRCVLVAYVCDGRRDCLRGEDESVHMCSHNICSRPDKLNCSTGRCISESACCRTGAGAGAGAGAGGMCQQPACCDEFTRHGALEGYADVEYPPLFDDRHAPDDYGFIQSTIYTVTACALIFMIAVVLLVSAICKMQMKRAALRGYTHADRSTRQHYSVQYHQAHRFPPCYEASRLLEESTRSPLSPPRSPQHAAAPDEQCAAEAPPAPAPPAPRGLARLSAIFSSRYRQVPTQPADVEMSSRACSPPRSPPLAYRSPTYCDLNTEFIFADPGTPELGRDLNYMATPIEFFRRRTMRRNTLERVMDQLDRQRLTLQLGRFQLSLPRLCRAEPRPGTPDVAELNIDSLDFVRLHPSDTYTLNGRTIRLLGADFENCPVLPDGSVRPPSYTEAVRYKLYGPPPDYLSRDSGLDAAADASGDRDAATNVEMPPGYDELAGRSAASVVDGNSAVVDARVGAVDDSVVSNGNSNLNGNGDVVNGNNFVGGANERDESHLLDTASAVVDDNANGNVTESVAAHDASSLRRNGISSNDNVETLSSIIDNLPAIDSDVNANDSEMCVDNYHVIRDVTNNVNNAVPNGAANVNNNA